MVELPRGSYRLPESLLNVRGDGNCLPRSIALAITGRQQMTDDPNEPNPDHKRLRELVVNHLLRERTGCDKHNRQWRLDDRTGNKRLCTDPWRAHLFLLGIIPWIRDIQLSEVSVPQSVVR